ncbi:MAG: hypothetical protein KDD51_09150, partial [Bdellovibrionales bacterium]|nr:hypothetical protein [Bdellovibrionales bacterium]
MLKRQFELSPGWKRTAYVFCGVGALSLLCGFWLAPVNTWIGLLLNNYYFLSVSLGGLFLVAIQVVANASWGLPLRKVAQSMAAYLPVGAVVMLTVLVLGSHTLYEWTHHALVEKDAILSSKSSYLNLPFVLLRTVVIFGGWLAIGWMLVRATSKLEVEATRASLGRAAGWAAGFLVFFAFSFSVASVDWIMSVEPHWFSTIFGVYCFSGLFVNAVAILTLGTLSLEKSG